MVNPFRRFFAREKEIGEGGRTMLSGVFSGTPTAPSRNVKTFLAESKNQPWLRAVENRIAQNVANTCWRLYQESGRRSVARLAFEPRRKAISGESEQYKELPFHPLLDMLERGNAELTGGQAIALTIQYLDFAGEAFWLVERGKDGKPYAFWPVPPNWVESIATPADLYFAVAIGSWRDKIPASDVVYFRDVDPSNPYGRGAGLAMALSDELETDEFAAKHVAGFFKNRARPDFIVMGKISPQDTKRLEREWVAEQRGFWNAFKPRFLSGTDFQFKELSQSFQSMELTDLRKFNRDYIAQCLGVPLELMGVVENSNRSTIDVADFILQKHSVAPRVEFLRSIIQRDLVPEWGENLVLDYEDVVPEDREFHRAVMEKSPHCFTVDEWRRFAGMDALPEKAGACFLVPMNLIAIESFDQIGPGGTEPTGKPSDTAPKTVTVEIAKEIATRYAGGGVLPVSKVVVDGFNLQDIETLTMACKYEDIYYAIRPILTNTLAHFGGRAIEETGMGLDFNIADPRVSVFIRTESSTRIKNLVNETTRQALRESITQAYEAGESIGTIQDRVVSIFDEARGFRSHNIARTETHRAACFGQLEGYRQTGTERVQWIATRGGFNRETHRPGAGLDHQIRTVGDHFDSPSGAKAKYPGDFGVAKEDCQCQCRLVSYTGKTMPEHVAKDLWQTFNSEEEPYIRATRAATRRGFDKQQKAVLDALRQIAGR